jgi:hypothetical protein
LESRKKETPWAPLDWTIQASGSPTPHLDIGKTLKKAKGKAIPVTGHEGP